MKRRDSAERSSWGLLGTLGVPGVEAKPRDLREQLAAALGTTDPEAIVAAIADYVGTFEHAEEHVARRLCELLPPGFGWVIACCDRAELRRRYEAEITEIWTIPAEGGGVLVFESRRERPS